MVSTKSGSRRIIQSGKMNGRIIRYIFYFIILVQSICLVSCNLKLKPPGPREIIIKATNITLGWDPPINDIPRSPMEVDRYTIYYRRVEEEDWNLCGSSPRVKEPKFQISFYRLGVGKYEFGVSSTTVSGETSEIHASSDFDADPMPGWYIYWIGSQ